MRSNRSWVIKAGVVLLSCAVAVGAAEFVLRHWLHAAPQLELDLYARDPQGNLRLRPNITRRHVTRLWDVVIRTNAEGWRDQAKTGAGPLILGLGDSMSFGWGVEFDETFLYLVEEYLRREHPLRLINASVPGTGPGDQFQLLQTIWPDYEPRVVVLSFFVGNDFVDVQMGGAAQFDVEDGLLVRRAIDNESSSWLATARSRLIRSSHLLQLVRAVQLNWSRDESASGETSGQALRHWDDWLREFAQVHLKEYPERTRQAVEDTLAALDEIETFCRARAVPLVLVVVPRSYQIYPEERQELIEALSITEADLDLDRPQRLLGEWAERRDVALVDLLSAFRMHLRQNPGENLYHYPDAHMNAAGHRAAAAAIAADAGAMNAIRSALRPAADAGVSAASPGQGTPLQ